MFCTTEIKLDLCRFYLYLIFVLNMGVFGRIKYRTETTPRTRVTAYKPRVIDKVCLLKPDLGPCRGNIPMFYMDPKDITCKPFRWGGCQGNGNRFDTEKECIDKCVSERTPKKKLPPYCELKFEYGYCFGTVQRWYYDVLYKTCKEGIYSGCGGNQNNFKSRSNCENVCRFGGTTYGIRKTTEATIKKILIVNPEENRGVDTLVGNITQLKI